MANASDAFAAIVPIGRQLLVSAFVFRSGFSSTWAANRLQIERKLATSYAPLVGPIVTIPGKAHFLSPPTSRPPASAHLLSKAESEALFHVVTPSAIPASFVVFHREWQGWNGGRAPVPPFCRCASANLFFLFFLFCSFFPAQFSCCAAPLV